MRSFGAGGELTAGGYRTTAFSSGDPSSAGSYEFRLWEYTPHVDLTNLLPNYANSGRLGVTTSRERVTLLSLGVRGVLPVAQGRVELFAGPSAVHLWSSQLELSGFGAPSGLIGVDGGGRIALDEKHRFWIGSTVRYSRDGSRPTEEWVSLTGEFAIRF